MLARFEKGLKDGIALLGVFEADALEMVVQHLPGFPHHLAGDGRLIVDASLKHGGEGSTRQVIPGFASFLGRIILTFGKCAKFPAPALLFVLSGAGL